MICFQTSPISAVWQRRWRWPCCLFLLFSLCACSSSSGTLDLGLRQRCPQTSSMRGDLIRQSSAAMVIDVFGWWPKRGRIFQCCKWSRDMFLCGLCLRRLSFAHPASLAYRSALLCMSQAVSHHLVDAFEIPTPRLFASILSFRVPSPLHEASQVAHPTSLYVDSF